MKGSGLTLAALLVAGGAGWWAWSGRDLAPVPVRLAPPHPGDASARNMPQDSREPVRAGTGWTPEAASPDVMTHAMTSEAMAPVGGADAEAIQAEALGKIQGLVVTRDVKSLPALVVFLRHADAAVREAAREGVVQLGVGEGARHLREEAARTTSPVEALALLDAAEILELPPVDAVTPEIIARQGAERAKVRVPVAAP